MLLNEQFLSSICYRIFDESITKLLAIKNLAQIYEKKMKITKYNWINIMMYMKVSKTKKQNKNEEKKTKTKYKSFKLIGEMV